MLPRTTDADEPPIGIMAAMPVEVAKLQEHVTDKEEHSFGKVFTFTTGKLCGRPVVFAPANVPLRPLPAHLAHAAVPRASALPLTPRRSVSSSRAAWQPP